MWTEYTRLCSNECPTHLILDFEKIAINAYSNQYPGTQVKGCFFHLTQNMDLSTDVYDLALYLDSTYLGRQLADRSIVSSSTFFLRFVD